MHALILALQEEKSSLKKQNTLLKQNYERVLEQFRLAQQQRFSRSSESNVLQMELPFDEAEAVPVAELPEETNTVTITYTRNKPKRRALPDDLPREVITHDIPEQDKQCACGCLKQRIGEEVTEQLDIIPAQLNEPGRNNTSTSHMWVYQSAKPDKKVILFDYRQALWPKEILNGYQGYLQTDGYSGYDWVNQHPDIIHLGCMAHARRPFAELVKLAKTTGKSHQAIAFFQKLYAIEKQAKAEKLSPEQRYLFRLRKATPILNEMENWLEQSMCHAVPQSKLGNALTYMHQRWKVLNHYLLDGFLEIDNNAIENQIRPFALGRKNWLFAATPNGAQASALFYSLIATANANGWNTFDYLRALFDNIRACKSQQDYTALLPFNLKKITT